MKLKLISVPIDEELDLLLRDAAAQECRTVRLQAFAELRKAFGLPVDRTNDQKRIEQLPEESGGPSATYGIDEFERLVGKVLSRLP